MPHKVRSTLRVLFLIYSLPYEIGIWLASLYSYNLLKTTQPTNVKAEKCLAPVSRFSHPNTQSPSQHFLETLSWKTITSLGFLGSLPSPSQNFICFLFFLYKYGGFPPFPGLLSHPLFSFISVALTFTTTHVGSKIINFPESQNPLYDCG